MSFSILSHAPPPLGRIRRSSLAALAALLLGGLLVVPVSAQTYTVSLTLGTTEIAAADLDGATIRITPEHATFILGGSSGGTPGNVGNGRKYLHPDDIPDDIDENGLFDSASYRLNALGLAEITLSGAPSGLTVSGARLLPVVFRTVRGTPGTGHRSAEITLAFSGSADAISGDVSVSVTVTNKLLRTGEANNDGRGTIPEASVSAGFVVKGLGGQPARQPSGIVVPDDWALIPAGVGAGDSFRLMGGHRRHPPGDVAGGSALQQFLCATMSVPGVMRR